jgi:SET domain-containing protein
MKAMENEYVEILTSEIHNRGVFAKKDIPKGTKIIEYVGNKITKEEGQRIFDECFEKSLKEETCGSVYLFELDDEYDIDGNVSWNDAKFINHSCEPNCESDIIDGKIWVIASRDIKKGEELCYDYYYDLDDFENHPCKCGKPSCIGYIVSEEHREELKKILRNKTNNNS